jgi:hypothetical protein
MSQSDGSRERLSREADDVRSRLMRTVENLARRRDFAFSWRLVVRRHGRTLAFAGGFALIGTSTAVALTTRRAAMASRHRQRDRWALARRFWSHPGSALRCSQRSFVAEVARSVALSIVTLVIALPLRRVVRALLDPSSASPQPGRETFG